MDSDRNRRRWRAAAHDLLVSHFGEPQLALAVEDLNNQLSSRTTQLAGVLRALSLADAKAALNPGVVQAMRREGAEEFAQAVERHWSVNTCATLKYFNFLSRSKYNDVRLRLSSAWSQDDGGWVRCAGPFDVAFPSLVSRYKIDN